MGKPNLILLMADQLRWDMLGCAGHPDLRTPNIDALAAHGIRFSEALSQSTDCVASRATVLTGQYPDAHEVSELSEGILAGKTALASKLSTKGYRSAAIGKIKPVSKEHCYGFDVVTDLGDYETWLDAEGQVDRAVAWLDATYEEMPKSFAKNFGAVRSNLAEKHHVTTWVGDQALRFFQATSEPFFLWAGFSKPAFPFDPPQNFAGLYKAKDLTLPEDYRVDLPAEDIDVKGRFDLKNMEESAFRKVLAYYYASVSHLDKQVGRMLATLTARGFTNNIFVLCADHGDYMGQHGLILKEGGQAYDSLLRVPLIVAGMTGQRHGVVDASLVELADLMPTLLEVAGVRVPKAATGKSLVPVLKKANALTRKTALSFPRPGVRVARSARHKMIESAEEQYFFDLKKDPHEFDNRIRQSDARVPRAMLKSALRKK